MIISRKFLFIVIILAVVLCCSILLLLIGVDTSVGLEEVKYTLDFPLMLPKEPGYSGEYLYTNIPRDRWLREDVDEWFVVPDDENLERLGAANEQVIIKILEAAP